MVKNSNFELQKQNDSLKKQIQMQHKVYSDLEDKYITLKSIIKEVREYIEDNSAFMENDQWELFNKKELYEILDKENK